MNSFCELNFEMVWNWNGLKCKWDHSSMENTNENATLNGFWKVFPAKSTFSISLSMDSIENKNTIIWYVRFAMLPIFVEKVFGQQPWQKVNENPIDKPLSKPIKMHIQRAFRLNSVHYILTSWNFSNRIQTDYRYRRDKVLNTVMLLTTNVNLSASFLWVHGGTKNRKTKNEK